MLGRCRALGSAYHGFEGHCIPRLWMMDGEWDELGVGGRRGRGGSGGGGGEVGVWERDFTSTSRLIGVILATLSGGSRWRCFFFFFWMIFFGSGS